MQKAKKPSWYVYLLQCADSTLYCGITTNLARRLAEHNDTKKAAKYTRARQPVCLVYSERKKNRSLASQREWQLKQLTKAEKLLLIDKT